MSLYTRSKGTSHTYVSRERLYMMDNGNRSFKVKTLSTVFPFLLQIHEMEPKLSFLPQVSVKSTLSSYLSINITTSDFTPTSVLRCLWVGSLARQNSQRCDTQYSEPINRLTMTKHLLLSGIHWRKWNFKINGGEIFYFPNLIHLRFLIINR